MRFDVVQQLQQKLKVFYQRQELSLIPFGSSMSKFGDKNSDLDMCLLTADYDETQYQKRGNLRFVISWTMEDLCSVLIAKK